MNKRSLLLIIVIALNMIIATGCGEESGSKNNFNQATSQNLPPFSTGISPIGSGPLPARQAPDGFSVVNDDAGTGRALTGSFSGNAQSATAAIRGIMASLGGSYFDQRPTATGAFRDSNDAQAQVSFTATINNVPVRGIGAVALTGNGGGKATFIFDRPESLKDSFTRLAQKIDAGQPATTGRAPVEWRRIPFSDGSGEVSLPVTWQLASAAGGTAVAGGPRKEGITLGGMNAVTIYPNMANPPALLTTAYTNPAQALVDLFPQMNQGSRVERVIETLPVDYPGGQSAYVHYLSQTPVGQYEGLAYVIMTPSPGLDYMWILNYSNVAAPTEVFKQELPTMLEIWKSWKMNNAYLAGRVMEAAQTMRSTNEIITQPYQGRTEVYAKTNEAWSDVIRGQASVEDTRTGDRGKADINDAYYIVEKDPINYRIVPLSDLNG